jgi:hypothetical protein
MAEDEGAKPKDSEDPALPLASAADAVEAGLGAVSAPERDEDAVAPTSADTDAEPAHAAKAVEAEPDEAQAEPARAKAKAVEDEAAAKASAPKPAAPPARRRASRLWWALPVLMVVEFYVYGRDGRLEICVGKEADTDFSLVGQERTDENRWKFPRCETRENLGLRSQREAKVAEGLEVACRGATIFRHQGQAKACVAGEEGWQHRVEGHFVPPWDPSYYRHLFWFLQ